MWWCSCEMSRTHKSTQEGDQAALWSLGRQSGQTEKGLLQVGRDNLPVSPHSRSAPWLSKNKVGWHLVRQMAQQCKQAPTFRGHHPSLPSALSWDMPFSGPGDRTG